MFSVTALMDNQPSENKALVAEHGLSLLIESEAGRILFDCGSGSAPIQNARRLGLPLRNLDAVVLSHSHYDHAAGYRDLIEQGLGSPLLWTGPHFFEKKYAFNGLRYTDLSAGFDESFLAEHHIRRKVCSGIAEIGTGMWLIGDFPRVHDFETIPERFVRRVNTGFSAPAEMIRDDFSDEICLALETEKGLVVLVGCSHPGILNMIACVHDRLKKPVCAVYGGTHLVEADEPRILRTVSELKSMGLDTLGLSHCSGQLAEKTVSEDRSVHSCHLPVGGTLFL